jgi:hypothetical protein
MDRPPGDLGARRPSSDGSTPRRARRAYSGRGAEIAQAIARAQLEPVERNLVELDRVRAIVDPDDSRRAGWRPIDFERLRAGLLERGFEWQKAAS